MKKGKRLLSFATALCLAFGSMPTMFVNAEGAADAQPATGTQLYVSPTGDDAAKGTIGAPLKTLEGARNKVRELKQSGLPAGGITVNLLGGEYLASSALELTAADSGEAGKPIVWKAAEGAEVTFSGTVSVEPNRFEHVTDKDILARLPEASHDNVYVCDMKALGLDNIGPIPKVGYGWPELPPPLNVVMDGESMHMARYPDKDFVKPSHIFDPGFNPRYNYSPDPTKEKGPIWACNDQGLKDMFDLLKLEDDVWTYGYFNHTYADDNVASETVEMDAQYGVKFTGKHPTWYAMEGGEPKKFYVYNILCGLDAPGEYYLDRTNDKMYVYSDTDIASRKVELGVLADPFFKLEGASYITIEGLHFTAGNANAIDLYDSNHILIADCLFTNIGQKGVTMNGDLETHDNAVQSCDFKHMGSGGVLLDGGEVLSLTPGNNKVDNCLFDDYSVIKRTYAPAVSIFGCGNLVTRNKITNAPHQAVAFSGNNHKIAGNEISHVLYETGDSGAIYTCTRDWTSRGNVITNNYFYDIPNTTHGGTYCIYLDDMASGTIATNNLFVNMKANAFLVGGGRDNVISNNIEVNNGGGFIRYDNRCMGWAHKSAHIPDGGNYKAWKAMVDELMKPENAASLAKWKAQYPGMFDADMLALEKCSQCSAQRSKGCIPKNAVIENNIAVGGASYSLVGEVTTYGEVNNNQSYDAGTDIGFVNAAGQNFEVKPDSKIEEIQGGDHFKSNETGMYRDAYRTGLGVQVQAPVLTSPAGGAQDVELVSGTAFAWNPVEGAGSYLLEISKKQDFTDVVVNTTVTDPSFTATGLEKETTYYWRVTAFEGRLGGTSAVSSVFSFKTSATDAVSLYDSFGDNSFAGWLKKSGTPTRTDKQAHAGRYSYIIDEPTEVIGLTFGTPQKQVFSVWMYDTMNKQANAVGVANVVPQDHPWGAIGVNVRIRSDKYVFRADGNFTASNVTRSEGWHEFKWDYTSGTDCKMYIDGQLVHTIEGVSGAIRMEIGDYWKETGNPGDVCGFMFDEVKIGDPVINPVPQKLTLDKTELTLEVDGETQLEALLDAIPDVDMPLEWTVEDQEVAIVENGRVTGKRAGDTKITVSVKDYPHVKAECTVHVHADLVVPIESVEISPTQKTVSLQDSFAISAKVLPEQATNKEIVWSSSDPNVAFVENGRVYTRNTGSAVITATSVDGGKTATCKVTVVDPTKLPNPGFELGDKTGWSQYPGTEGEGIAWSVNEGAARNGVFGADVTTTDSIPVVNGKGYAHKGVQYRLENADQSPLRCDVNYTMKAWVKAADDTTHEMGIFVIPRGGAYSANIVPTYKQVKQADGWVQLEISLTPEQLEKYTGMNKLDFIIGNKNTTESAGHFFVDDAELTVGNQIAHTHDLVKTEEKAATCTEDGNKAYWTCNSCKKLFADENSTTETTLEQVTLKATGHTLTHAPAKEATCTADGNEEYWTCSQCKKLFANETCTTETTLEQVTLKATGHSFGEWKQTKAPTCTEAGEETRSCACGEIETREVAALDHSFGEWTQTKAPTSTEAGEEERTCATCGYTETREIPALDHSFGDWTQTKAPTCTEAGEEARSCATCGYTETREVAALGHKLTHIPGKAATCTADGNVAYWSCSQCEKLFADEKSTTVTTLEQVTLKATGHHFGDWTQTKAPTCTEVGTETRSCACGVTEGRSILALGHHFGDWAQTKAPTCTEVGTETRSCACGVTEGRSILALGHSFGGWMQTKAPTCTEAGVQTRSCACGVTETRVVAVLAHKLTHISGKAATCTADGNEEYWTCSQCKNRFADENCTTKTTLGRVTLKATGHHFGEWKQTKAPTCTEAGVETRSCTCDVTETREAAALGHKLTYVPAKEATATSEGNIEYYVCSECGKYYSDAEGKNEIEKDSLVIEMLKPEKETNAPAQAGGNFPVVPVIVIIVLTGIAVPIVYSVRKRK